MFCPIDTCEWMSPANYLLSALENEGSQIVYRSVIVKFVHTKIALVCQVMDNSCIVTSEIEGQFSSDVSFGTQL